MGNRGWRNRFYQVADVTAHCHGTAAAAYSAVRVVNLSLLTIAYCTVSASLFVLRAPLRAEANFPLVGPEWSFLLLFAAERPAWALSGEVRSRLRSCRAEPLHVANMNNFLRYLL